VSALRPWLLPVLLVLNGGLALAISARAATLRQSWQAWEGRTEAAARLRYVQPPDEAERRARGRAPRGEAGAPP
jgi:hypothetical protein